MPPPALKVEIPNPDPLFVAAHKNPAEIDTLLRSHLLKPELMRRFIHDEISLCVTPELYWTSDEEKIKRSPSYYLSCLVHATLLGRAYAAVANPPVVNHLAGSDEGYGHPFNQLPPELLIEIHKHYTHRFAYMQDIWDVMQEVFIKALFSGTYPEPGARYIAAILILTAGKALSQAGLQGKGKNWVWYDGEISDEDSVWGWEELKAAVVETERNSRDKQDLKELIEQFAIRYPDLEYVPKEAADALALAVNHIWEDEEDLTSQQVTELLLPAIGQINLGDCAEVWVNEWSQNDR